MSKMIKIKYNIKNQNNKNNKYEGQNHKKLG